MAERHARASADEPDGGGEGDPGGGLRGRDVGDRDDRNDGDDEDRIGGERGEARWRANIFSI